MRKNRVCITDSVSLREQKIWRFINFYFFLETNEMDLQSVRDAFLCQLCPTVSQEERKKAFNLVQQFKSSPANSQIKIIFALIADQDG